MTGLGLPASSQSRFQEELDMLLAWLRPYLTEDAHGSAHGRWEEAREHVRSGRQAPGAHYRFEPPNGWGSCVPYPSPEPGLDEVTVGTEPRLHATIILRHYRFPPGARLHLNVWLPAETASIMHPYPPYPDPETISGEDGETFAIYDTMEGLDTGQFWREATPITDTNDRSYDLYGP
ncbi:MAG: hypothetical protein ACYCYA_03290 [Actinomycetes bacterium]